MRRARYDSRVMAVRLPVALIEALDETADYFLLGRTKLVEMACEQFLDRLGARMEAGDSDLVVLGFTRSTRALETTTDTNEGTL